MRAVRRRKEAVRTFRMDGRTWRLLMEIAGALHVEASYLVREAVYRALGMPSMFDDMEDILFKLLAYYWREGLAALGRLLKVMPELIPRVEELVEEARSFSSTEAGRRARSLREIYYVEGPEEAVSEALRDLRSEERFPYQP